MRTDYRPTSLPAPRVSEMPVISATELKNATADVFEQVAAHRSVAITRHNKPRAILLSIEQYETLTGQHHDWLKDIYAEYQEMFDKMQKPEQRAGAERAFNATPEELAGTAVRAAAQEKARQQAEAQNAQ